jgi:hypothetical protein
MAATREVEILQAESIATAGVKTLNLDLQDSVSRLDVIWRKTNTNRTPIAHPGKIIKNILVCDGADVLFSMCGQDAIAMSYYQTGSIPGAMTNYELGQWSMCIASIFFGREMWDEELALDPKRFSNIQIKIDHDLALGGATGTVADLSVYAHVFDEKVVQPRGFLLNKEIYSFLPVASAYSYIDFPVDYPIRAVMFGANECEDGPEYNLNSVKIEESNGKHILVNSLMERYLFQTAARDPIYAEHVLFKTAAAATDLTAYQASHWERRFVGNVEGAGVGVGVTSNAGCKLVAQNATAAAIIEGFSFGHVPFGQVYIPFGKRDAIEDSWDIRKSGSGRLILQAGATPDTDEYVRVHVQQARLY